MFSLIKQLFTVLLSFSSSVARDRTKCISLNDEPCIIRPTLIGLNVVELKHYQFMIILILLYFAHSFVRDHITVDNCYYLLSLCKT